MSAPMKPSLVVFAVRERNNGKKAVWSRIGAAWPHKEGSGFNIELETLPINFDGRLVLMPPKEEGDSEGASSPASGE
jgi:hypothetical protein